MKWEIWKGRLVSANRFPSPVYANSLYLNTGGKALAKLPHGGACRDRLDLVGQVRRFGQRWMDRPDRNQWNEPDRRIRIFSIRLRLCKHLGQRELLEKFSPKKDENFIFRNLGGITFSKVSGKWGFDETGVSYGLALADFDRDGDLDAAVASMETPYLLYRNDSQEGATVLIRLMGRDRNRWGIGATLESKPNWEVIGGPCHPLKATHPQTLRFFISAWGSQIH